MTLCVVGAGAMGRWVAETVECDVAFADVDPAAASDAAARFDGEALSLSAGTPRETRTFETVCLAVPMSHVADAVADWAPHAEAAMIDVSGVMRPAVAAMGDHLPDRERASLHPLFAPERAPGNVAYVADQVGPVLQPLLDDIRAAGNALFETTPEEHDAAMETVQGATHTAVLAWALAADDVREEFHTPISSGLADLAATVTEGDAHVYADIQSAFDGAGDVADAARRVADIDTDAETDEFAVLYAEAAARASRLKATTGDEEEENR
jgi:prephenate dehydrogenase